MPKVATPATEVLIVMPVKTLSFPDRLILVLEFPVEETVKVVNTLLLPITLMEITALSVQEIKGAVKVLSFPVT